MKTFKIFSTAALALMMAACSSEDTALNNSPAQQQGRKVHFTATIAAPGGNAGTRTEYTEVTEGNAAGTINVAWKAKDEIALIHNGTKDVVTVETVNEDGSATITGDITVGTDGEAVIAYYPAAAIELNNDKNPVPAKDYSEKMLAQDGTLSYIASNLDLRVGKSTLAVDGDKATLSDNVKLTSQIAIWKLSLLDGESNVLQATQVKIKGGTSVLASTATIAATSEVTLAIPTDVAIDGALTIEATVGSGTYAYTKEEVVTFDSKYYQSKVTMAPAATDLSKLTGDYTAKNGETLTGTLAGNYKISIAAGATVTLDGVTINGVDHPRYTWAGITCEGDATIILKDGSTNTVKGFYADSPGIQAAVGHTLTIKGTGSLTASSNGQGAGIGGGYGIACGNIKIEGGKITATGSSDAAGIGSANNSSCGSITISGGTVKATGGNEGAGIGSGYKAKCGDITISGGTIEATGGTDAAGIGSGYDNSASCGDITISGGTVTATGGIGGTGIGSGYLSKCGDILISGGTVTATGRNEGAGIGSSDDGTCGDITITTGVTQVTATKGSGSPNSIGIGPGRSGSCGTVTIGGVNTGAISTSPYTYQNLTYPIALSAVTSAYVGSVVTTDGNVYATAAAATAADKTAAAMICYVSSTGHGLALALADESSTMNWSTAITTAAAHTPTVTGGTWKLATKDEWDNMFTGAGGAATLRTSFSGVNGTNMLNEIYWSSTEGGAADEACGYQFSNSTWNNSITRSYGGVNVRACLAF